MRRLKKQLADERSNRDELEMELTENRKLLTEKGGCQCYRGVCVGSIQGLWDLLSTLELCLGLSS